MHGLHFFSLQKKRCVDLFDSLIVWIRPVERVSGERVVAVVMSSPLDFIAPSSKYGGLKDGYRRSQLGVPTGTVGQPPKFRGEKNKPGDAIKAPKIYSSSARQNRGTNVTIPYARVAVADELANIGRMTPGDVVFVHRNADATRLQITPNANARRDAQSYVSMSTPHAQIQRLAGLDYMNRCLSVSNFEPGYNALVNSNNACDDWRNLRAFHDWVVDGIILSNDSPGYVLSSGQDARNDRIFNIAVQGLAQVNNGYEDNFGNALESRLVPNNGATHSDQATSDRVTKNITSGPFGDKYPTQMFDRKVRPLSELFVGIVCEKIDKDMLELDAVSKSATFLNVSDSEVEHVHTFRYVLFSNRQAWQFAEIFKDGKMVADGDILDSSSLTTAQRMAFYEKFSLGGDESEPASHRMGPSNPKRGRVTSDVLQPRKVVRTDVNYNGISGKDIENLVGAWRLGKVLDIASQRKEKYPGGLLDTAFKLTLNVDIGFMDWRALRLAFGLPFLGENHCETHAADAATYTRVMKWPTYMYKNEDKNVPMDTESIEKGKSTETQQIESYNKMKNQSPEAIAAAKAKRVQAQAEAQARAEAKAKAEAEEAEAKAQAQAQAQAQAEAKPKPKPKAKAKPPSTQNVQKEKIESKVEQPGISDLVFPTGLQNLVSPPEMPKSAGTSGTTSQDDVMAEIFGSSASAQRVDTQTPKEPSNAPRKFARRNRDKQ